MRRFAFNGGLYSPEMDCRPDVDSYHRGCRVLMNLDVSPMGGIKRRRGMRTVTRALATESRLIPFRYGSDVNYLVEVSADTLRVLDAAGKVLFTQAVAVGDVTKLRFTQRNAWLILTSEVMRPKLLKATDKGGWTLEDYAFDHCAWYTTDERDDGVTVTQVGDGYSVAFEGTAELAKDGDLLRVSHYTDTQEARLTSSEARAGLRVVAPAAVGETSGLSADMVPFAVGDRVAVVEDVAFENWTCIAALSATDYIPALDLPGFYSNKFVQAPSSDDFEAVTPVYTLTKRAYSKDERIRICSGYWRLYTCIREFDPATELEEGKTSPSDYAGAFVSGIPMGEALPCRGSWKFVCSGTWYGCYEVRRHYSDATLSGEWETRGQSFSAVGSPQNNVLTGDEQNEECWLRLMATRVRCTGADISHEWPADTCENKLVVASYQHDLLLRCRVEGTAVSYTREDKIQPEWRGDVTSRYWSWAAFSERYGYPRLCCVYGNRMVFASTVEQPQTLWMSRADDLTNFLRGDTDAAAIQLTMSTAMQSPMAWLLSKDNHLYIGTADAEWSVGTGNASAVTPSNARLQGHGNVGSRFMPAILATDKLLFVERGSSRVWEFFYNYEVQSYNSKDLTVFASHIGAEHGGFTEGDFIRKPDTRAVFVLGDGRVAMMTYNSMHEVNAWSLYETHYGQDAVRHVAVLPQGDEADAVFFITERTEFDVASGSDVTVRYIEVIDEASTQYVDAGKYAYTSTMVTNALDVAEQEAKRAPTGEVLVRFGAAVTLTDVEVSTDGTTWSRPDVSSAPAGWVSLVANARWEYERLVGIRTSGRHGLHVLAIQG